MSAEIISLAEARCRRVAGGQAQPLSDIEAYRTALARQKVDDDRRWIPCDGPGAA